MIVIVNAVAAANTKQTRATLGWLLDVLCQRPHLMRAIHIGHCDAIGDRLLNCQNPWWLPAFDMFDNAFRDHVVGQWLCRDAQLARVLRNICVRIHSDKQCNDLVQLLKTLQPSNDRRSFGVRFCYGDDMEATSIESILNDVLTLLCAKSPALDTISIMLEMHATPEMFKLLATNLHPTVTSLCVHNYGLLKLVFIRFRS